MIAEIMNKPVDKSAEDQLTGNVFGTFRYLTYTVFKQLLIDCVEPQEIRGLLSKILPLRNDIEWGRVVEFWPRHESVEPDVVMDFGEMVIMIEVKYNSSESGDSQIRREAELLQNQYNKAKHKFLFLTAPVIMAKTVFKQRKREINTNFPAIKFGYITWQRMFDAVKNQANDILICSDIAELLDKKGFAGFRGFNIMDKNTMDAFKTVIEAYENVEKFITKCIELADDKGEYVLAPINKSYKFLRWKSDANHWGWLSRSFFVVFQYAKDRRHRNSEWRNGPLYVIEISFNYMYYPEYPVANIIRYDYHSTNGWEPLSVTNHEKLFEPLYYDCGLGLEDKNGKFYGVSDTPLEKFWGLESLAGFVVPLSEITQDNVYEQVFERFNDLRNIDDFKSWFKKK